MNQDQLRDQIAEAFNSAYRPNPPGCEELDETSRHDGHHFSGGCYVCRGDVPKLVDAVLGVVAPLLADRAQDVKWIAAERDEATAQLVRDATAYRDERDAARAELGRLHSWAGLMELLDEHWPAEVFAGESEDSDPGPRIVSLIRAVDTVEASRRDWATEATFSSRRREPRPSPAEVRPCSCLADGVELPVGWSLPQCSVHLDRGGNDELA